MGKGCYKLSLEEVFHDEIKDSGVLEESSISKNSQEHSKVQNLEKNDREELVIEDREVVKDEEEEVKDDSSYISRVSNSVEDPGSKSNSVEDPGLKLSPIGGELFWDFPNSIDRSSRSIIQTGNMENFGNSQTSICNLLHKIKLKGVERPRKRKGTKILLICACQERFSTKTEEDQV